MSTIRVSRLSLTLALALLGCDGKSASSPDAPIAADAAVDAPGNAGPTMSFFISSRGVATGGDFRRTAADTDGLAGADEHCRALAAAADPTLGARPWRAYLSTSTVNAKDRIGKGPWHNQKLVVVAGSVADLLDPTKNQINKANGLDEKGQLVPGRGDTPNEHDILTGTLANGTAAAATCSNWTSSNAGTGMVGHHDRGGGGTDPTSWSSAHATGGCAATAFPPSGGRGSIYCFVAN